MKYIECEACIASGSALHDESKTRYSVANLPPVRTVIDAIVPELGMPDTFDGTKGEAKNSRHNRTFVV